MAEKTKVRKPRPQGKPGESTDGQRWAFETRTPDLLGSEVKRLQEQRGVASGRGASRQRCQTAPWFPGRTCHSENGREEAAVVSPSPVLEVV